MVHSCCTGDAIELAAALARQPQTGGAGVVRPPAIVVEYMGQGSLKGALYRKADIVQGALIRVLIAMDAAKVSLLAVLLSGNFSSADKATSTSLLPLPLSKLNKQFCCACDCCCLRACLGEGAVLVPSFRSRHSSLACIGFLRRHSPVTGSPAC